MPHKIDLLPGGADEIIRTISYVVGFVVFLAISIGAWRSKRNGERTIILLLAIPVAIWSGSAIITTIGRYCGYDWVDILTLGAVSMAVGGTIGLVRLKRG